MKPPIVGSRGVFGVEGEWKHVNAILDCGGAPCCQAFKICRGFVAGRIFDGNRPKETQKLSVTNQPVSKGPPTPPPGGPMPKAIVNPRPAPVPKNPIVHAVIVIPPV